MYCFASPHIRSWPGWVLPKFILYYIAGKAAARRWGAHKVSSPYHYGLPSAWAANATRFAADNIIEEIASRILASHATAASCRRDGAKELKSFSVPPPAAYITVTAAKNTYTWLLPFRYKSRQYISHFIYRLPPHDDICYRVGIFWYAAIFKNDFRDIGQYSVMIW